MDNWGVSIFLVSKVALQWPGGEDCGRSLGLYVEVKHTGHPVFRKYDGASRADCAFHLIRKIVVSISVRMHRSDNVDVTKLFLFRTSTEKPSFYFFWANKVLHFWTIWKVRRRGIINAFTLFYLYSSYRESLYTQDYPTNSVFQHCIC